MSATNNLPIDLIQKINLVLKANQIQTLAEEPLPSLQNDFKAYLKGELGELNYAQISFLEALNINGEILLDEAAMEKFEEAYRAVITKYKSKNK